MLVLKPIYSCILRGLTRRVRCFLRAVLAGALETAVGAGRTGRGLAGAGSRDKRVQGAPGATS